MKKKVLLQVGGIKKLLLLVLLCSIFTHANGLKKSKVYYCLFSSESGWVAEDSCMSVSFNIQYGSELGEEYNIRYPYFVIKVKNKTMKTIYIDLANTFLVKGEESFAYYVPGETVNTRGSTSGASVNLGSVTSALGVGGIVGTLASGTNVGGSSSSSSTNVTYAQRVISIPPMSAKTLSSKPIIDFYRDNNGSIVVNDFGGVIQIGNVNTVKHPCLYLILKNTDTFCGGRLSPGSVCDFTKENSPMVLSSYITYSASENFRNAKTIHHTCYTEKIIGCRYYYDFDNEVIPIVPDIKRYKYFFVYCSRQIELT